MKFYMCVLQTYIYLYTFSICGNSILSEKNKELYGVRPLYALFASLARLQAQLCEFVSHWLKFLSFIFPLCGHMGPLVIETYTKQAVCCNWVPCHVCTLIKIRCYVSALYVYG